MMDKEWGMGINDIGVLFGRQIGQKWGDLLIWEEVLNLNPHLREIVEVGTWQGGMSYFLYAQCQARDMNFCTIDINEPISHVPNFTHIGYEVLPVSTADVLVFCDNGSKPDEAEFFGDSLSFKSCIAVHDWGTEFREVDIPEGWRAYRYGIQTIWLMRDAYLNEREVTDKRRYP